VDPGDEIPTTEAPQTVVIQGLVRSFDNKQLDAAAVIINGATSASAITNA
jgi:hypothetical protein